jgi:hypothetical protein
MLSFDHVLSGRFFCCYRRRFALNYSCHKSGSLSYLFFPISQNARNVASTPGKTAIFTIRVGESPNGFEPDVGGFDTGVDQTLMNGWENPTLRSGTEHQVPPSGSKNPVTAGWRGGWGKSMFAGWQAKAAERGPAATARVALMGNVTVFYGVKGEGDTEGASLSGLRSTTAVLAPLISRVAGGDYLTNLRLVLPGRRVVQEATCEWIELCWLCLSYLPVCNDRSVN